MAEQPQRDATFGHFGYEEFLNGITVPFVYRSNAHLFSRTMLQKHLTRNQPDITNLEEIEYLKKQMVPATTTEIKLLDEINHEHNNNFYPKISFFEKLLRLEDAAALVQFQIDCGNAKNGIDMMCGGFVRLALTNIDDKEYILPYYVKNGKDVTPVELVKKFTQINQAWDIIELKNIEVLYMQFLVSLYKSNTRISEPTLNCITIDDLKKDSCSRMNKYWPKPNESIENTVIPPIKATTNNNYNKRKNEDEVSQTAKKSYKTIPIRDFLFCKREIVKTPTDSTTTNNNEPKPEDIVIPATITSTNNNKPKNEDVVISTVNMGSKKNVEIPAVNTRGKHENAANSSIANKGKNNNKRKYDDDSDEELDDGIFVVKKIIKCRQRNGGEALVRWEGYSSADDTWEPLDNLNDNLQQKARKMLSKKR